MSLVLASAKIRDHADDGDGALGTPGVRGAATALAARWAAASARTGRELGFEVGVLTEAIGRQTAVEAAAGPGTSLLTVTEPTETATGAAFAHTAVLAGKPGNAAALAEAGRLFGRIAHLADAAEDLAAGRAAGAWNPLLATGTAVAEARRLCDDALLGIRLALAEAEFRDSRLVHTVLVHELTRSVHRIFGGVARTELPDAADAPEDSCASGAAESGDQADAAHGHGRGRGLPLAGLAALAALPGLMSLRRRRGCCCDCGEDCCCECSCECCGDACCDGCCDSCDCGC
ncbi:regulator [Trebonia kvetii]|uniref:regulator n=1 Tax=Trebonia kvetii TaxID=2480626 RepID=UPI00319E8D5E